MLLQKFRKDALWVLFCLAGVALNVLSARIMAALGLPLYLDCQLVLQYYHMVCSLLL